MIGCHSNNFEISPQKFEIIGVGWVGGAGGGMDRCFGAILHFNELQRKLTPIVKSAEDKRNKTAFKKIKPLD